MNIKLAALALAFVPALTSAQESISYPSPILTSNSSPNISYGVPQNQHSRHLQRAFAWAIKRLAQSDNSKAYYYTAGNVPSLSDYQSVVPEWTTYACYESDIGNKMSGVWLNGVKKGFNYVGEELFYPTQTKEFIIATGSPFEIESKNYARAGLKRYAKYFHSFQIYGSQGTLVINNSNKHDYTNIISFENTGSETLNSLTFSDFEIFVGAKYSFGDELNFSSSTWYKDAYKLLQESSWGSDFYISDCSFAAVKVERNTRPTVTSIDHSQSLTQSTGGQPGRNGNTNINRRFTFKASGVADAHTPDSNLNYVWDIGGLKYYTNEVQVDRRGYRNVQLENVLVSLTISDGDLSRTIQKTIQW